MKPSPITHIHYKNKLKKLTEQVAALSAQIGRDPQQQKTKHCYKCGQIRHVQCECVSAFTSNNLLMCAFCVTSQETLLNTAVNTREMNGDTCKGQQASPQLSIPKGTCIVTVAAIKPKATVTIGFAV